MVLGRNTYYTILDEQDKRSGTSWKKERPIKPSNLLPNWFYRETKMQSLDYEWRIYLILNYRIQKIAYEFEKAVCSIKILFLPVSHSEFNPVEMEWSSVKRDLAGKN